MRRTVVCLWMMIKRMGKHPVYWGLFMLFPLAVFVVPKFNRAVKEEQISIGYVMAEIKSLEQGEEDGEKYTRQLLDGIECKLSTENDGLFKYIKYIEEEGMRKDILTGKLSGGIVFDEEFTRKLQRQNYHRCILLYLPEGMNLGGMVREDVFQRVYQAYSAVWYSELLKQQGYQTEPQRILRTFSEYQKEGKVFAVQYEAVNKGGWEESGIAGKEGGQVLSLRSVLAFLVFLAASLGALDGSRDKRRGTGKGISTPNTLAAAAVGAPIIPAILFLIGGLIFENKKTTYMSYLKGQMQESANIVSGTFISGEFLGEIGVALAYGFVLWLSALIFSRLLPEKLLEGIMPCFLLMVLLCCPVFFDLGETIPLIGYISKWFPLTWYLIFGG